MIILQRYVFWFVALFQHTNFKTEVKLVAFDDNESFKMGIDGSHTVFCAIGTTLKKMEGNKEEYRKIDFDIAVNAARYCKETGCTNFLLVSSVGANSKSNNFYLKLKGEIEEAIKKAGLRSFFNLSSLRTIGRPQRKKNR